MKDTELAEQTMALARRQDARFADIRILHSHHTAVRVQDSRAESLSTGAANGAGVRVLVEGCWGFASTEQLNVRALCQTLEQATALARAASRHVHDPADVPALAPIRATDSTPAKRPFTSVTPEKRAALALSLEAAARKAGRQYLVNTIVRMSDTTCTEVIANTAGTLIEREDSRVYLVARCVGEHNGLRQTGTQVAAMRCGAEGLATLRPENTTLIAVEKVHRLLRSAPAPSGRFPAVFHPSIPGLLAHEALGHNAEADAVRTGQSALADKLGRRIAPETITIWDDPTWPGSYGSYQYDSEGTPARKTAIIREGRLVELMHSLETAAHFGVTPNGSGRAEDYSVRPIVRMSNTYFERGTSRLEELIGGVDRGIYLEDGNWGHVFVESGQFTCHAGGARMIERGALGEPLRDVSITGSIFETLANITRVADDFEMEMPGHCGKADQGIPINAGGPHLLVDGVVVGGQYPLGT